MKFQATMTGGKGERPVIRFSNSYFSKVLASNVAKIKLAVDDEDYDGKEKVNENN